MTAPIITQPTTMNRSTEGTPARPGAAARKSRAGWYITIVVVLLGAGGGGYYYKSTTGDKGLPITTDKAVIKTITQLVNATGKVGRNVCRALLEAGFEVYGTTRSPNSRLTSQGVTPVVCNYTVRADLDRAFKETGARKVFVITDYFRAAKSD